MMGALLIVKPPQLASPQHPATVRPLRLPLSLSAHNDLLVALHDFAQAVWSDARLPGDMRQELQAQYHNVVRPAILTAQEELDRRLARIVALDPSSKPGDRSVAYSEGPWVVQRDLLGELAPFNSDGTHLLTGEGDDPLPLEEREANGRLISAAPQHDARLRATTAFLRRLVSAHPDEIADYMTVAAEHFEMNLAALAAVEVDADTDPTPAESLVAGSESSASPSDLTPFTAAGVIVTRVQAVRNLLREHGWDRAFGGDLRKEVGAVTLGFDHKVETVGSGHNLDVSVAYIAWDTSEGEYRKWAPPLVQLTDPMSSAAAELVSQFEAELEAALRARGHDMDLQQGTASDEMGPK
jgi:hypothetical protein